MLNYEYWEDRPDSPRGHESIMLAMFEDNLQIVTDICHRRAHMLESTGIINIVDACPEYSEHYDKVADIITTAVKECTPIIIAGDYDVDGMTATAVLYSCIKTLEPNAEVAWWIPKREDGYGINAEKIQEIAHDCMFQSPLIITVDNGIAAAEEIAKLPPSYKVVVTDHHLAEGKELPKCEYVLDPKVYAKEDSDEYMGSGCYVAAKLGLTLLKDKPRISTSEINTYCEILTGLSILSDVIPLNPTMRAIMNLARIAFSVTKHSGLSALLFLCNYRDGMDITTSFLSYIVIPKLNAAGRMGKVEVAMKLLLQHNPTSPEYTNFMDDKTVVLMASDLFNLNRDRKIIEESMMREAFLLVEKDYRIDDDTPPDAVVVYKSDWLAGIVGIIAARLVEVFNAPVICLTGTGILHGSGRAPQGYDLYSGLASCSDILLEFGGHRVAGGVSLAEDKLGAFRERFSKYYKDEGEHRFVRYIDSTTTIDQIKDVRFQIFLKNVEPFGNMNEPLNILLKHVTVLNTFKRGETRYFVIADKTDNILVSKFRPEEEWYDVQQQDVIDLIVTPNLTYFSGATVPEYRAVSFRHVSLIDTPTEGTGAKVRVFTDEAAFKQATSTS